MKSKIWRLGWNGMEEVVIDHEDLPKDILKVDDWYKPTIGELCLNDKNKIDVVKSVYFRKATDMFKASVIYKFENSKNEEHKNYVHRIEVKKGESFTFKGKDFIYQKPLGGDEIRDIAINNPN